MLKQDPRIYNLNDIGKIKKISILSCQPLELTFHYQISSYRWQLRSLTRNEQERIVTSARIFVVKHAFINSFDTRTSSNYTKSSKPIIIIILSWSILTAVNYWIIFVAGRGWMNMQHAGQFRNWFQQLMECINLALFTGIFLSFYYITLNIKRVLSFREKYRFLLMT